MSNEQNSPVDERDITLREEFRAYVIMVKDDIARILDGLPQDTAGEAKDIKWLITELVKTRRDLMSLEERIAHEQDDDPTRTFDFDALRRDIGGRLDKLRIASGATGISEQSNAG